MAFLFGAAIDWLVLFSILIWSLYYYSTKTYDYWKKRGIPYTEPVPFFGNSLNMIMATGNSSFVVMEAYKKFSSERFFGRFVFRKPVLVLRDPELIETVLIKDFSHFYNRSIPFDPKLDKLSQHLVNLRDKQWKGLRNKLTPVFTSGKLKSMHQTLINCSESLAGVLDKYSSKSETFEARDVMANFTTEVIGHCAFGLKMNTLQNPDSEFRKMGKEVLKPSWKNGLRFVLRLALPKLVGLLKWRGLNNKQAAFFRGVIKETMEARAVHNIEVNDFIQLLINLRKEDQKKISEREESNTNDPDAELLMDDDVMTSNALVFFLAGFETTASTLGFCLFELAQNPDIQEKLRSEVKSVLAQFNGVPTFEAVKQMSYLDNVISETLRKYPPAGETSRDCAQDWVIPGTDIMLTKGSMIAVPIHSLHHDPQYYPEPERFLPERFSEENKHNLTKCTFLPFGDGPRICIGKRFAELEMKVALSTLINRFKFTPNSKTQLPLEFHASILLVPKGGLWVNVQKLQESEN